ncbi:ribosomal protein [Paenibacillus yonginensis]|uniref:Ribosomal processing cysteine protease Prp n=1 Tax=Paenibacillus yonginensis TaxID=1462996 RepID=A0A1B1N222_9BACL|nr:ribosomal-processing cysteine protease Prp [Paenibacillus yonginensis]ANS75494.1 ribosomal protein [Paenibacillus yonginensis]
MIIVTIKRDEQKSVTGFRIEGHANFAEAGRDIVCAGVSAVTVGSVNAVEELTGIVMDSRMKNGFLSADLPPAAPDEAKAEARLLLSSLVVMLRTIEQTYGQYVKIIDVTN